MHPVFLMIILFSLVASSLICSSVMKTRANKWTLVSVAFCVNVLILSVASVVLYKLDVQTFHKQTEGLFDSMGIVVLVFFVPINTLVNIHVMKFFKNKKQRMVERRPS